ncbi:hypothetical protein SAMN04487936_11812 [Halobacillus dabanensis]|uniref:Uncharacterized protein n=1 Tax=Halobacillus dabanensis TaxID=240302 RepID=A0A1I4AIV7_HALDA|nr:hypothetical protein SAMN04487936_11812 [Halobacillus dabanensis]
MLINKKVQSTQLWTFSLFQKAPYSVRHGLEMFPRFVAVLGVRGGGEATRIPGGNWRASHPHYHTEYLETFGRTG